MVLFPHLVLQGANYASAQCRCIEATCNDECCVWQELEYENTTESLSDINGTPYGYGSDFLPGLDDEFAEPCIRVEYPEFEPNLQYYLFVAVCGQCSVDCFLWLSCITHYQYRNLILILALIVQP